MGAVLGLHPDTVGAVENGFPVGSPVGVALAVAVVRQAGDALAAQIDLVEVGVAVHQAGNHDGLTVRAPGRVREGGDALGEDGARGTALLHVGDHEAGPALPDEGVSKLLAVRRPGAAVLDVAQLIHVAADAVGADLTDHLARAGIGQEEVDVEQVALGEVDQVLTVGADLWRDVDSPAVLLSGGDQFLADVAVFFCSLHVGVICLVERLLPEFAEILEVVAEYQFGALFNTELGRGAEVGRDDIIALQPGHERPKGLAVTVGEVLAGVELLKRWYVVVEHRVAHPHSRKGVYGADAEVFRQAFHHPKGDVAQVLQFRPLAAEDHIVLEGVDQLVAEHVVRLLVGMCYGQHHPVLEGFGYPARSGADGPLDGVRLLKIRVVGVDDHRVLEIDRIPQHQLVDAVPFFRVIQEILQPFGIINVGVELKVRAFVHLEVKVVVMGLIAAEAAGLCRHKDGKEQCQKHRPEVIVGFHFLSVCTLKRGPRGRSLVKHKPWACPLSSNY